MKNLLTLGVTKIRTDFQHSRNTLRQTTQNNHTLTTLILSTRPVFISPRTEGKFIVMCLRNLYIIYV